MRFYQHDLISKQALANPLLGICPEAVYALIAAVWRLMKISISLCTSANPPVAARADRKAG